MGKVDIPQYVKLFVPSQNNIKAGIDYEVCKANGPNDIHYKYVSPLLFLCRQGTIVDEIPKLSRKGGELVSERDGNCIVCGVDGTEYETLL